MINLLVANRDATALNPTGIEATDIERTEVRSTSAPGQPHGFTTELVYGKVVQPQPGQLKTTLTVGTAP